MNKCFIILMFVITSLLYGQQFQLTYINSTQYSIDKIAQQLYFKDFYTDTVRKIDMRDMSMETTNFSILTPNFGNEHHLLRVRTTFYDLDKQSSYTLSKSESDSLNGYANSEYTGAFSPSDSNFFFPMSPKEYVFSFKDNSLKSINCNVKIDYSINDAWPQWSSDTSFVYLTGSDDAIAKYFIRSRKIDTLISLGQNSKISGFSYNKRYKILAYSIYNQPPQIFFHYVDKSFTDSAINVTPCSSDPTDFTSLTWSPDESMLAFICGGEVNPFSSVQIYYLDSKKQYSIGGGDVSHFLRWANNDTLIFANTTRLLLFGVDVSSITSVRMTKKNRIPNRFAISNYPNPFNPSTVIHYQIPKNGLVAIKIYDELGREVKTLVNKFQVRGGI